VSKTTAPHELHSVPQTTDELMQQALAMEREAVARYNELADIMEVHNNHEVAELFRKMAVIEGHHVSGILSEMGWAEDMVAPRQPGVWASADAPESVPLDEMHYLMHPWHALQLALGAEQRAEAFFESMAQAATNDAVREAALEMRDEEAEHVALIQEWLARTPQPDPEWAVDPDPPRYTD
jgi:rubrerythrin